MKVRLVAVKRYGLIAVMLLAVGSADVFAKAKKEKAPKATRVKKEKAVKGQITVDLSAGASPLFEKSDGWTNGGMFNCTWRTENIEFKDGVMTLTIDNDEKGDGKIPYSGAEYRTKGFYGYGRYEVEMKPIKNDGVVSSFFTYTGPTDNNPWDEIDIEFLGKDTTSVQFNYFRDGKGEHEHVYKLGFDASEEWHTYGFEWHNDCIVWFVDDAEVYTVKGAAGEIPLTPGKLMMNTWPGINVDTWLKPYDGNVPITAQYKSVKFTPFSKEKAPKVTAKPVVAAKKEMRAYTDDGNLVYDGDFADAAGLGDGKVWSFYTAGTGEGSAAISDGVLAITTTDCGDLPYSIQLVQPNLPMVKGKKYTLTFEAKASEERKAVTGISAPDANWIRYFADTTIDVGTDWQEYKFDFEMTETDDPNGRLEYNLGNLDSTATFELRNVRVAEAQ